MLLGMLYFIARGWNVKDARRQKFYIVTTFIAGIAFTNYLAMAAGFGVLDLASLFPDTIGAEVEELKVYWPRYTDWILTTPLLLYDLALLAGADRNTIATLVGLDVMMILTGAVATLTGAPMALPGGSELGYEAHRLLWWGVSTGFFLVLIFYLFRGLSEKAAQLSGQTASTFNTLRYMIVALWFVYPVPRTTTHRTRLVASFPRSHSRAGSVTEWSASSPRTAAPPAIPGNRTRTSGRKTCTSATSKTATMKRVRASETQKTTTAAYCSTSSVASATSRER
jgi:bacteriorhodopsin